MRFHMVLGGAIALACSMAACAAEVRIYLERNGQKVQIEPASAGKLSEVRGFVKAYKVLMEPKFRAYLEAEQRRTGQDVEIVLVDDRGPAKDVWPHASGRRIKIGASWFQWYTTRSSIRGLLAHEFAHTQDNCAWQIEVGCYGPDNKHFTNEMITERSAFAEGWANYQGVKWDPWSHLDMHLSGSPLFRMREDGKNAGKYGWHPLNSFKERLSNEMEVAKILRRIARSIPEGPRRIDRTFDATNDGSPRTLATFLARLAKDEPAVAGRLMVLVDTATDFAATDAQLEEVFGPVARRYAASYRPALRGLHMARHFGVAGVAVGAAGPAIWATIDQGIRKSARALGDWARSARDRLKGLRPPPIPIARDIPLVNGTRLRPDPQPQPPRADPLAAGDELAMR